MKKKMVLIIGSGHLVSRLKKLIPANTYDIIHTTLDEINSHTESDSLIENLEAYTTGIDLASASMVYLIDGQDEINLQLIIALISLHRDIPITAALFNENLTPHLQHTHNKLTILNPAKIAAPSFVEALYQPIDRQVIQILSNNKQPIAEKNNDLLIEKLVIAFIALLLAAVVFFHFVEKLSWINSLYFVIVTVATVGYGDINLLQSSTTSKLFAVLLILASTVFIWMIFSLTIDRLLKKRIQRALGRKKYNFTNHVIVCGLGKLGYFIVEELLRRKEKVIIIEQTENSRHIDYFRNLGAEVYIGDARLTKVLSDVNTSKASALISVINNDSINLEIGLNARSLQPDMRLILRIFDEQMAQKIKEYLNIHLTLSASAIADEKFYDQLINTRS
jgi:voltage-gated potassium channel Kch